MLTNRLLSTLSRIKPLRAEPRSDLEKFRAAQALAYEGAVAIARELKVGMTSREAAARLEHWFRARGVRTWFHRPLAWFGNHSRFDGFRNYGYFLPSTRKLARGDVAILDCAPVVDGVAADIGFTFALEPHDELTRARAELLRLREEIPRLFETSMSTSQIWAEVDSQLRVRGFDNCHARYPFQVLGHRLHRVPFPRLPAVLSPFTLHSYWALLSRGLIPELMGPWHEGEKRGLWAIEPHLGADGFGAKFEEILVVDDDGRARWLDDAVPHVQLPVGLH
jgi:Xaa-Pro aminopeptidase